MMSVSWRSIARRISEGVAGWEPLLTRPRHPRETENERPKPRGSTGDRQPDDPMYR